MIGVHLVGGMFGALVLGLFAEKAVNGLGADGLFFGGGLKLLGNQLLAVVATLVFSGAVSALIAIVIDKTIGLRVTHEQEQEGLDLALHAEAAYALGGRL